ncbi:flippase [Tellurirhabdus rosea]|uniref:flippase n=1 Tax=Tellurirhabdus rosea TaxID=2674997 RepID=UPI00225BC418|nr:flippase [Tellurirhabdus rosea]
MIKLKAVQIASTTLSSLKNTAWILFDRIFRMTSSLIVGLWLAQYFGPEKYGLWSYAFLIPSILTPIVNLGLTNIIINKVGYLHQNERKKLLLTSFILRLTLAIIAYTFLNSLIIWAEKDVLLKTLILYTSSNLLVIPFEVIDLHFQTTNNAVKSIKAKSSAFIVGTAIKLYFLLNGAGIESFAYTIIIENILSVTLLIINYLEEKRSKVEFNFQPEFAKNLLKDSFPIMISELLIYLYMRLDQYMIKYLSGNEELGLYSAAQKLSESWYFIAGALTTSFLPNIISQWNSNKELFYSKYQKLLNSLAIIAIMISIIVSLSSPIIENIIFRGKFNGVGLILSIHIWTGIPVFLGVGSNTLFILNNLQKSILVRSFFGIAINLSLNLLLIPHFGAVGASIATLCSQIFTSYVINYLYKNTREIFLMQTVALTFLLKLKVRTIFK